MSTSDRIHIAVEERLIEAAIADALKPKTVDTTAKRAYQARYEITAFDGNEMAGGETELQFGPTVITTRRNFFLKDSDECAWWTMGDFLDENQDGQPDILEALELFRDTASPAEYTRILRNRATRAATSGTIDLVNLIQLDGRFSQTNQLLSPCFSATNEDEFVFETIVGIEPGQTGILTNAPDQTEPTLLAGSTAIGTNPAEPIEDRNIFFDEVTGFVDYAETILWINLVPNQLLPGKDDISRQGKVYFQECSQFDYFQ